MLALMIARAAVLAVMIGVAGGLAARRARLLTRLVRLGRPVERGGDVPRRVAREGIEVLGQRKLFQRALPGLMHALIFWGFLVLLTTIVEVAGEFRAGDAVEVRAAHGNGRPIGKGIVNYSAEELRRIRGMKSADVLELMPRAAEEAVHRDYFVLE